MAYTSHGHLIPGTEDCNETQPPKARCGGITQCRQCANEAFDVKSLLYKNYVVDVSKHNEATLGKVRAGLAKARIPKDKIDDAIREMQNYGIIFRERI